MKNLTSVSSSTDLRFHRLRWFAVLAAAVASTLVALMQGPGSITVPVHALSRQTREAGAITFHDKGCEHCHGIQGIGTDRGPELSTVGKRWKKDHIEKQIREGGGGMPPFGEALQPDEVKDLVDYLSAKRKAAKAVKPSGAGRPPVAVKPPSEDAGF